MLEMAKQKRDKFLFIHALHAQMFLIGMAYIFHATTPHDASSRNIPFDACSYVIYAMYTVVFDSSALILAVAPWQAQFFCPPLSPIYTFYIRFSPNAWGGGGYLKVHASVGNLIDWYNIQVRLILLWSRRPCLINPNAILSIIDSSIIASFSSIHF